VKVRRLAIACIVGVCVAAFVAPPAVAGSGSSGGDDGEPTLEETEPEAQPKRTDDYRDTIAAAIDSIQEFWEDNYDDLYGDEYEPIPEERIFAAKPGVKLPKCQGTTLTYEDASENAFYCYEDNFIAYDDVNLFPRLHRDFGELAVPLVMAHEWGHGIQDRAENDFQADVLKELQADCFAGAWVGYVANEGDPDIKVRGGNLDQAMTAMLEFRDPVGTASDEQGAHGSGFDRVTSLQAGFEGGPETCAPYFDTPPTIVEIPFTSEDDAASGGNLPPDEVIPAAVDTLNDFYANVEPLYVTKTADDVFSYDSTDEDNLPECGGTEQPQSIVKNRVFYCIDDGTFGYDEPYLQRVYDEIGDFGVITLFSNPYATYVQTLQGFPGVNDNADNAVLGADCYTGGYAAALFNNLILVDPDTGLPEFTLSPGDLDESIQAFIDYTSSRGVASDLDVTFLRVRAFRDGFTNGYAKCAEYQAGVPFI
jgi:predicted metalloprotease